MSFLFETISIPFWFIAFVVASASPLWFRWYKIFHGKYITTGILQKKFRRVKKSSEEFKDDILNKANEHIKTYGDTSAASERSGKKRQPSTKLVDAEKKKNIRAVLSVLAEAGETGILPKSISDKTKINTIDTKASLKYLAEKEYAEEINSTSGIKYYLTDLGRRYCINKRYISK